MLLMACEMGDVLATQEALDMGANVNSLDGDNCTVLMHSAHQGKEGEPPNLRLTPTPIYQHEWTNADVIDSDDTMSVAPFTHRFPQGDGGAAATWRQPAA